MALYKHKEFAELCGISEANLSTYKKRGKVVAGPNGLYDDTVQQNADFLKKRIDKHGIKLAQPTVTEPGTTTDISTNTPPTKTPKSAGKTREMPSDNSLYLLEKQKKSLDIEKTAEEIELLRKKNEKMDGELLPTDLIQDIFRLHFTTVHHSFKNGIDNILTEWQKKKDFTRKEMTEIKGKMTKILNHAIDTSIDDSKKSLANIITEYSIKRGVGERT